jgi:hypothetical protein
MKSVAQIFGIGAARNQIKAISQQTDTSITKASLLPLLPAAKPHCLKARSPFGS